MANENKSKKSKKKVHEETHEPVTKCDQSNEVVANCDHLEKGQITFNQHDIEKLILTIRGKQVLIDRDLGKIYGVETKRLNEQVRRNIARFPDRYRFQLTKDEMHELVANCDRFKILKHSTSAPYAFTVFGVSMLPSVLNSQKAIETSIKIIDAFVAMRSFMIQNADILSRIAHLERHQIDTDEKIDLILDKMEENSPKMLPEQIFQTGCVWDAWSYVSDLVRSAKSRIALIDNFVDDRVLSMLDKRAKGVMATIYSRYYEQFQVDLKKHNEQYPAIEFIQLPHKNHDRFLIIDDKVHFMGASLKDMGAGLCAVTEMQITPDAILEMLK
ncbi:MAG: ORF6N domain-containing protein [Prevotella sp.]|nr:ORF6N domain-containing protein [Prevotella sp.]MBQ8990701.1 ORF6N domain-containing protein [Prevotella sp.]